MKKVSLKTDFISAGLSDIYRDITTMIGKEPDCGDDFADVVMTKKSQGKEVTRICKMASKLDRDSYYDAFKYHLIQYEAEGKFSDYESRIELLSDLMEYSYIKEYVIELVCLYLEVGKTSKARRVLMTAASGIEDFPEKNILLDDIKNNTKNYQEFLCTETPTESFPDPVLPFASKPEENNVKVPDSPLTKESSCSLNTVGAKSASAEINGLFEPLVYDDSMDIVKNCPEFIENEFRDCHLSGMRAVKEQLSKIYHLLQVENLRRKTLGIDTQLKKGMNFILYGNPGTGKTSVARIIGAVLYQMGMVNENKLIETDRSGLVGSFIGGTEEKTEKVLEAARGKTLFIDEAYTLYNEESQNDFGRVAIDMLLKDIEDHRGEYCVILAGYKAQMQNMIKKANRGFASRFDYKIEIPDYSTDELINILVRIAESKRYKISSAAKNAIASRIEKEKIDETFDNARFMRRLLDEAIEKQSLRLVELGRVPSENDLSYLLREDFLTGKEYEEENVGEDDYLAQLDSLIGLSGVKKEVHSLEQTARIMAEQKKRGIRSSGVGTLHLAFTGNPGTGKTTVARLLGKIYAQLGLLKRGDVFVECDRSDLVGSHVGETALKVVDVVRSAMGGILFIDEVYNLVNSSDDIFGLEALAVLITEMENNADKLMVIIAGYTDEVKSFIRKNPGMSSRISKIIEFDDYTVEEMVQIFRFSMKKRGLKTDQLKDEDIYRLIDSRCHVENFGNGRGVRNICDEVVRVHNSRLAVTGDLSTLSDVDFVTLTNEDIIALTEGNNL